MTALASLEETIEGAPPGQHVAPRSVDEVAQVLKEATHTGTPVRVWGGGTKQKFGNAPGPGIVMSTHHLDSVEQWEPDDLTLVVGAGARVADVEEMLGRRRQTAVLPELPGASTIGGTIATGTSSLRRGRLYGIRERVLEVTLVTGDGRVVRSGGRVVKNVSGFDIHKAVVGAFGSLGVVVSVCFKLWPVPEAGLTVLLEDPADAVRFARPLAVLESAKGVEVFLWGTRGEIDQQTTAAPGAVIEGLHWPAEPVGDFRWSLRVPPALVDTALSLPDGWRYLVVRGVGEVRLGSDTPDDASGLREWAEGVGGSLVLIDFSGDEPPLDPWGSPPSSVDLQRRLIAEFDPARIINPGRLPGDL